MSIDYHHMSPQDFRERCRSGDFSAATAGVAGGYVQANLMILPRDWAFDFLLFCQRNPKPCPLVEVLDAGQTAPDCAPSSDLRTDLPGYRIFREGILTNECGDIAGLWQPDFVSFLIGCSFSFESALIVSGIRLRHVEQERNVAMYKSNIACAPAGRLRGNMVVSMRPIRASEVAKAVEISARYPMVHGAPVHIGHPHSIGIDDLSNPDFGDPIEIKADEIPVFWACGVTPQWIACQSGIPFCITHAPGKMFVTDRHNRV